MENGKRVKTGYGREIEYLTKEKGYHLNADKTALIKD